MFWIISTDCLKQQRVGGSKFLNGATTKETIYAYSDVFIEQGAVLSISADIASLGASRRLA